MKAIFFPLGGTQSEQIKKDRRCLWRELEFLYSLIKIAITPKFKLNEILNNYGILTKLLEEKNMKRQRQLSNQFLS
jgi:hypothetical protein